MALKMAALLSFETRGNAPEAIRNSSVFREISRNSDEACIAKYYSAMCRVSLLLQLNEHLIPVIFQTSGPQMLAPPPAPSCSSQHKWHNNALWDICVELSDANTFVSQRHQTAEFVAGGSTPLQVSDDGRGGGQSKRRT